LQIEKYHSTIWEETLSKKEKLIQKLKSGSLDFTIDDAEILLSYFGDSVDHKGKTSGSGIRLYNPKTGRKY